MLRIFQVMAVVAGTAAATAALADPPPVTITLPATVGDVEFPHRAHFKLEGVCWACHERGHVGKIFSVAAEPPAAGAQGQCPTVPAKAPSLKERAHGLCLECHRASGAERATVRCYGCHRRRTDVARASPPAAPAPASQAEAGAGQGAGVTAPR